MVKSRQTLLAVLAVVAVLAGLRFWMSEGAPVADAEIKPPSGPDLPWINLDRLKSQNPELALGRRNIFGYHATPPPYVPTAVTEIEDMTPVSTMPPGPTPTPAPPPLTLKFMGVAQPDGGKKIALLLTEQKEILHGREGDVLAGRYRINKIGLESVEVEEVTTGQKQNIPIGGRR